MNERTADDLSGVGVWVFALRCCCRLLLCAIISWRCVSLRRITACAQRHSLDTLAILTTWRTGTALTCLVMQLQLTSAVPHSNALSPVHTGDYSRRIWRLLPNSATNYRRFWRLSATIVSSVDRALTAPRHLCSHLHSLMLLCNNRRQCHSCFCSFRLSVHLNALQCLWLYPTSKFPSLHDI